jgi:hypothetical protein
VKITAAERARCYTTPRTHRHLRVALSDLPYLLHHLRVGKRPLQVRVVPALGRPRRPAHFALIQGAVVLEAAGCASPLRRLLLLHGWLGIHGAPLWCASSAASERQDGSSPDPERPFCHRRQPDTQLSLPSTNGVSPTLGGLSTTLYLAAGRRDSGASVLCGGKVRLPSRPLAAKIDPQCSDVRRHCGRPRGVRGPAWTASRPAGQLRPFSGSRPSP